jgi:hypothetical protein
MSRLTNKKDHNEKYHNEIINAINNNTEALKKLEKTLRDGIVDIIDNV